MKLSEVQELNSQLVGINSACAAEDPRDLLRAACEIDGFDLVWSYLSWLDPESKKETMKILLEFVPEKILLELLLRSMGEFMDPAQVLSISWNSWLEIFAYFKTDRTYVRTTQPIRGYTSRIKIEVGEYATFLGITRHVASPLFCHVTLPVSQAIQVLDQDFSQTKAYPGIKPFQAMIRCTKTNTLDEIVWFGSKFEFEPDRMGGFRVLLSRVDAERYHHSPVFMQILRDIIRVDPGFVESFIRYHLKNRIYSKSFVRNLHAMGYDLLSQNQRLMSIYTTELYYHVAGLIGRHEINPEPIVVVIKELIHLGGNFDFVSEDKLVHIEKLFQ